MAMDASYSVKESHIISENDSILKYIEKELLNKPNLSVAIITSYVVFCTWIGPALMKNRQPFRLTAFIFIYDLLLAIVNIYLVVKIGSICFPLNWNLYCPKDISSLMEFGFEGINKSRYALYFYVTKFVDLFDTVFFVISKKDGHISFLHIIHHAATPLVIQLLLLFHPEASYLIILVVMNCCIHVVMYSYYGLNAIGLKFLSRFKKYLTRAQIVQFIIGQMYISWMYYIGCIRFSYIFAVAISFGMVLLLLFLNFYFHNYIKKKLL